ELPGCAVLRPAPNDTVTATGPLLSSALRETDTRAAPATASSAAVDQLTIERFIAGTSSKRPTWSDAVRPPAPVAQTSARPPQAREPIRSGSRRPRPRGGASPLAAGCRYRVERCRRAPRPDGGRGPEYAAP